MKILIIEDERLLAGSIKDLLEIQGFEAEAVYDGETGFTYAGTGIYDLIILDVMMPGTDGITYCQNIRSQVDCPVLFLTAKTDESSIMYALGSGGDDYITKPFGIGELRARVQAHLRREKREKKHAVTISGVRFDLAAKQAQADHTRISLTKSEYEISEFLAMNHGQVFSKEQIFEHVFGYDRESDVSAITEHVKNIRAKFSKAGIEPIETVWGIGYKWK